ncbi:MAG: Gfo/Idh/MocA family oxidoreductase [Flavobacteriaceae bacterium]
MTTRRLFIEKISKGVALSTIALSAPSGLAANLMTSTDEELKLIRIGIIGAENSHTRNLGKLFNIDKKFPGVEVKYVWGETEAFALDAMKRGGIPNMVRDPKDMMGKIDALIVDHRDGKYHLEAAYPFVKAGIPTFIDKPFSCDLQEAVEFLQMSHKLGTAVTSFSSIANSYDTFDIMDQVKELGEINQVVCYGPLDMSSKYNGVFFYGAHIIQPLMYIFGNDVKRVRITKNGKESSGANLVFGNGMLVTLVFTTKKYGWRTFVETDEGVVELKSRLEKVALKKNNVEMVEMFRTGKEPRSYQSILSGVAVLEALQKSVQSEEWEAVANVPEIQ